MTVFRKIVKFVMRYKILIFAAALLLCFGGELVTLGNEVGMRVLVTSIGIDRDGEDYSVSAQVFMPKLDESKTQSKFVITVTAPTIADAVAKFSLKAGRIATVAHCRLVVLGESLFADNIMKPLNYFLTDAEVGWGAIVVATGGKAEETLNGLNDLEKNASFSWQKFLSANRDYDTVTVMSLREAFLKINEPGETFLLNLIDVEKPDKGSESGGTGGESDSGATSSASGLQNVTRVSDPVKAAVGKTAEGGQNDGGSQGELKLGEKTYVMRGGVRVGELTEEEVRGYSWFDERVGKATFPVKDVQGGDYDGATVSVRMQKRKVKVSCKEENGAPILGVKVDAAFDEIEILKSTQSRLLSNEEVKQNSDALAKAIQKEIEAQIEAARKKSLALDADFLSVNSRFFRAQTALYDRLGASMFHDVRFDYSVYADLSR